MARDPAARKVWNAIYEELSAAKRGVAGKVLSRAEAQAHSYGLILCGARLLSRGED